MWFASTVDAEIGGGVFLLSIYCPLPFSRQVVNCGKLNECASPIYLKSVFYPKLGGSGHPWTDTSGYIKLISHYTRKEYPDTEAHELFFVNPTLLVLFASFNEQVEVEKSTLHKWESS